MVTLPLGINAYKRQYAFEPEVQLINRFMEQDPANLREHTALLARPGTTNITRFGAEHIRGLYSTPGLFNGDLFGVSGSTLYRYNDADGVTAITGTINGTGHPNVAWMVGDGYEYLFISDGLLLSYYAGGTHATGTLTNSGTVSSQVIDIGGTYYSWNTNVDHGTPDGTSTAPWLANLTTDPLASMADLLMFNGVRGTDFSTALGGPSTQVTAIAYDATGHAVGAAGYVAPATTMVLTSITDLAAGNSIATSIFSGTGLAWGGSTLSGGGIHAIHGVPMPDGQAPNAVASVSGYVLVSIANSRKFYWLQPGDTTIIGTSFAEKESNPDNIVDMVTVGDTVIITGEGSTENWYATGTSTAPFAPIEGRVYMRGSIAGTAVLVQNALILVGDDGIVYSIGYTYGGGAQYGVTRISTHGIEERIRTQLRAEQGLT